MHSNAGKTTEATPLELLKRELEELGERNDGQPQERETRLLNITRGTGEFLSVLVRSTGAKNILEVGTSNGYSTLWLAEAAHATGGHVTTLEKSAFKIGLAEDVFSRSGLSSLITIVPGDAAVYFENANAGDVGFIFLDSHRPEYERWWSSLKRMLRPGGLLVVDNATSHPEEISAFRAMVEGDPEFTSCLVPVGKGEFMAVKGSDGRMNLGH